MTEQDKMAKTDGTTSGTIWEVLKPNVRNIPAKVKKQQSETKQTGHVGEFDQPVERQRSWAATTKAKGNPPPSLWLLQSGTG